MNGDEKQEKEKKNWHFTVSARHFGWTRLLRIRTGRDRPAFTGKSLRRTTPRRLRWRSSHRRRGIRNRPAPVAARTTSRAPKRITSSPSTGFWADSAEPTTVAAVVVPRRRTRANRIRTKRRCTVRVSNSRVFIC